MNTSTGTMDFEANLESNFVMDLCSVIDTPRSLTVYLLLKYQQHDELVNLQVDSRNYDTASDFADDYLVTSVLQKSPNLKLEVDRKEQAISSFWESELRCWYTNERVRDRSHPNSELIKRKIADILGPLDLGALQYIEEHFRHGPGATATLQGRGMIASDKFDKSVSLTIELYPFYKALLGTNWHESQAKPATIVGGSKFGTVPKNAKTDRGTCAEPTLNMFLQLGIGSYIRKRLKRFECNLNDQSRNQQLAQLAWSNGLSTLDLRSASDCVASNVIMQLIPEGWVELLALARSHRCFIQKQWHELEKWSSMGNGYTFELESLLFWSTVLVIVPPAKHDLCGVYGDDIICPREHAAEVIETLEYLGFKVNDKKSFLDGNFFESCGADYFKGVNVRPFFLKGEKKTKLKLTRSKWEKQQGGGRIRVLWETTQDVPSVPYTVKIVNALRLYTWRRMKFVSCERRYKSLWKKYARRVPKPWNVTSVPAIFGDTGVIRSLLEAKPHRIGFQYEGYKVRYVKLKSLNVLLKRKSVLLAALSHGVSYPKVGDEYIRRRTLELELRSAVDFYRGKKLETQASYGKQSVRGYLGRIALDESRVQNWTDGLDWL